MARKPNLNNWSSVGKVIAQFLSCIYIAVVLATTVWATEDRVRSYKAEKVLSHRFGLVTSVRFAPDASVLASCGHDGSVKTWNAKTWNLLQSYETSNGQQVKLVFSATGKWLASLSQNGGLWALEVKSGASAVLFPEWRLGDRTAAMVRSAVFSADDQYVITGNIFGWVRYWRLGTGDGLVTKSAVYERRFGDRRVDILGFSNDKKSLVLLARREKPKAKANEGEAKTETGGGDEGYVVLWDATKKGVLRAVDLPAPLTLPRFMIGGDKLAFFTQGSMLLVDADTGRTLSPVTMPTNDENVYGTCVALSNDGKVVAVGAWDDFNKWGAVWFYDFATRKQFGEFKTRERPGAIAFSPDRRTLAVCCGGSIHLVDIRDGPRAK